MTASHVAEILLTGFTTLLALGWFYQAAIAFRGIPTLPDLILPNSPLPTQIGPGPDVTVVVPACNEEACIQATLRSLLASTGVRLQIIAVNDRSTDRTGLLMDEVAAEASEAPESTHQLEIIHNAELPSGWLGKTHALALGASCATAPWLLFTDGDVAFDPRAIALSLGYAQANQVDHIVVGLTLEFKRIAEAAVFAAFQSLACWNVRLWKVGDPKSRDFFGAGGFNFVRRAVFEQIGGFSDLRMEIVEDLRLGWKIKRAGFAQRFVLGAGLVRIHWIQGAFGIVNLMEKNGFAGVRYRVGISVFACLAFSIQILLPLVAITMGGWPAVAGLAFYAGVALTYAANRPISQVSPWVALFFAPATALVSFAIARSTLLALRRNGVVWRGTLYTLDELRRNTGRSWKLR